MNQDWMKRTPWTRQVSTSEAKSVTTGYKAGGEDIELPLKHRKSSSTEGSPEIGTSIIPNQDITNGSVLQPARKIFKSFKLTTRCFGLNYTITETTRYPETPVYFAVSCEWNAKQPDIVLHTGDSKNGHPVAVAYFRFSRHIRMGFGRETLTSGDGMWEQMRNASSWWGHWRYEFEYNVPNDPQGFSWGMGTETGRTRTKFVWERTRDPGDGVTGWFEQHVGVRNYRLVEETTGRVWAVILASILTGCRHKADIHLCESLPEEMETMVILTGTCILEKSERRIRKSSGGAASGGGP